MAENLTPTQIADLQISRLSGATTRIQQGIEAVTEAPGEKAARAKDKMRTNLLKSLDDGTWEQRVASVSLADWKKAAIDKGIGRIATGITNAKPKIVKFHEQRQQHQAGIDAELANMPDVTLEDSINRMTKQVRGMAEFNFKR